MRTPHPTPIRVARPCGVLALLCGALACGGGGHRGEPASTDGSADGSDTGSAQPPPSIDAVEPSAGPFGTEVTLLGSALAGTDAFAARFATLEDGALTRCCIESADPIITAWSDAEIRLRWPFPYTGHPLVQTEGGVAIAPVPFEPTWAPGPRLADDVGTGVHAWFAAELDAVAALVEYEGGLRRIVHGPGGARDDHYPLSTTELHAVSFHLEPDGVGMFAAVTNFDQLAILWIDYDPSALGWSQVDAQALGDPLVAGTLDATVPTVWAHGADGTVSRYRYDDPYEDTWITDRGPIPVPDAQGVGYQATLLPSGELLLVWAAEGTTPTSALLAADVDVFSPSEVVADATAASLTRARAMGDPTGAVLATWCPAGEGWSNACIHAVRAADGSWTQVSSAGGVETDATVAGLADGAAIVGSCTDEGLRVGAHGDAELDVAVWPCDPADPAVLIAGSSDGRSAALVRTESGELYFARSR